MTIKHYYLGVVFKKNNHSRDISDLFRISYGGGGGATSCLTTNALTKGGVNLVFFVTMAMTDFLPKWIMAACSRKC